MLSKVAQSNSKRLAASVSFVAALAQSAAATGATGGFLGLKHAIYCCPNGQPSRYDGNETPNERCRCDAAALWGQPKGDGLRNEMAGDRGF